MEYKKVAWILLILLVIASVMGIIGAAATGFTPTWTFILADLTTLTLAVTIVIDKYL